MIDTQTAYNIATAGLLLLTAVPTLVIFLCSLCLARRRKDPARSWLALYKAAFGCFVLSIVLFFFDYALAILHTQLYDAAIKANASSVLSNILRAQVETGILGSLFDDFAVIFALVALLSLGVGAGLVHAGKESAVDKVLLFGGYGLAALLSILNIVAFALSERQYTITFGNSGQADGSSVTSTAWSLLRATRNVTFAMLVIRLVFNVAVLVKSILVAVQTKSEPRATTATRYLLVCCTLLLLRTSYNVGYYARYVPLGDPQSSRAQHSQPGAYFAIVDVVLNFWPMFIVFVVLFALGVKKQRGLWASEQPFMMVRPGGEGMPSQQTPWGFEYTSPDQQPIQPAWQQQQQQQQPAYFEPQELPPQHAATHTPQFRHEVSPQQHWREVPSQHHHQSYEMSVQTGSTSPPPPSHFETMGLNHQADGTPPQTTPLPYNEKK
ncbi:Uncharacterized protein TPAR_04932 [Tolypocladium paradoxum]|uniref:Uncharacterized protein n=1 Tax=Tolypocladium paradoxum TaxID=94208 RepID=A0A2S4KXG1_9HYPO|nr:Uncharacterized protein TPAR_04932 [Tolypocladium paradoxum]